MLEDIMQLHQNGRLAEAESGYRTHLGSQPEDHRAMYLLATLLDQRSQLKEAEQLLNQALALAPERAEYLVALGRVQHMSGHHAAARVSLQAATRINPNAGSAYEMLARIAMMDGDVDEAERQVKLALRVNPESPEAQLLGGSILLQRGDHGEALRILTPLAQKFPRNAAIQVSLGQAFLAAGMTAFGEKCLRNALDLAPDALSVRTALFDSLMQQGQIAEARSLLADAAAATPDDPDLRLRIGHANLALGDFADAVAAFEPLAARLSGQGEFVRTYVEALARAGRVEDARQCLETHLATQLESPANWRARAQLEHWAGDRSALEVVLERWLAAYPQDPSALEMAALLHEDRQPEEAESLADRAIAAGAPDAAAYLVKARAQLRRGEVEAAGEALQKTVQRVSQKAVQGVLHATLGVICHHQQKYPEALQHWLKVHHLADVSHSVATLSSVESLPTTLPPPAEAAEGELQPIFLIAAPGCGGEQAAALLQDLGLPVFSGRFLAPPAQRHGFAEFDARAWRLDPEPELVEAFAARYREAMARVGIDPARRHVDCLPGFDAACLPTVLRAFPAARLVVAWRDRRDALLHWLASGSFHPAPLADLEGGAAWLARACAHADYAAAVPGAVRLDIDAIAGGGEIPPALLALAGLDAAPELPRFRATVPEAAGGGVPLEFQAGEWQHFAELLGGPYAALNVSPA